jgi:hypothetical protein
LYPLKYGGREKELGEGRAAMAFRIEKGDTISFGDIRGTAAT